MLLTQNLLVLIFAIKIFSRKPLFTYIKEQHGIESLRQCRSLERNTIRYEKICYDLRFLLTCKKEGLVPTFAKPKFSIDADTKLRKGVASLIIKAELKNKHRIKNELKDELRTQTRAIKDNSSFLLFQTLRYKIRSIVLMPALVLRVGNDVRWS